MTDLTVIEGGGDKPILTVEEQEYFDRMAYLQGLHDLAEFLEEHPALPLPGHDFPVYSFGEKETPELAIKFAKELRTFTKEEASGFLNLAKSFGPIQLRFVFYRSNVCEKTVVGTKTMKKKVPVGEVVYEMREVEEEIVEWKCPSLLKGTTS